MEKPLLLLRILNTLTIFTKHQFAKINVNYNGKTASVNSKTKYIGDIRKSIIRTINVNIF